MKLKSLILVLSAILIIFLSGCTIPEFGPYDGPYFLGLGATNIIPNDAYTTSNRLNIVDEQTEILTEYHTNKSKLEYLIVYIEQPEEVEDQYVISSITIEYPDGSKIKWTNSTQEPTSSRKWYSNVSNTKFYIPITAPNEIDVEGYRYAVTAIQYIDGTLSKDVRFEASAIDFITIFVLNRELENYLRPHYNPTTKKITLRGYSSVDDVVITNIYVNNILALSINDQLEDWGEFTIPQSVNITTQGWLRLTFEFEDGIGGTIKQHFLAENYDLYNPSSYDIYIRSGEELALIPKTHRGSVTIIQDITLDSTFEPFITDSFTIYGVTTNTITCDGVVLLWDFQGHYEPPYNFASFHLRDIQINGIIEMKDRSKYHTGVFAYASRDHFILSNIDEFSYLGPIQLNFNTVGGNVIAPYIYKADTYIHAPNEPVKEGYLFAGWYYDESYLHPFTFNLMPGNNITIYAKWVGLSTTITYDSNGGSLVDSTTQEVGTTITPPQEPIREGYAFEGWFVDSECTIAYEFDLMPSSNIILYAKWTSTTYTITFETNGGSIVEPMVLEIGTLALAPTEPTKEGFSFDGWYLDIELLELFTFDVILQNDSTLYAKWTLSSYTLTFNSNEGSLVQSITGEPGMIITEPAQPVKEGHEFMGWFEDAAFETPYIFDMLKKSCTLYAKWEVLQYEVSFYEYESLTYKYITVGRDHVIAYTIDKRLLSWGLNNNGQLGDGTTISRFTSVDITSSIVLDLGEEISGLGAGNAHSFAYTSNNRVFAWGFNNSGQLGTGDAINQYTPTEITSAFTFEEGEIIIKIDGGEYFSSLLTNLGNVWMWGSNTYGQIGDGTFTTRPNPTKITSNFALTQENEFIKDISLGYHHVISLSSHGKVFTWGSNQYYKLGDGTSSPRNSPTNITSKFPNDALGNPASTQVYAMPHHNFVVTSTNFVYGFGLNDRYQLGIGSPIVSNTIHTVINPNSFYFAPGHTVKSISGGLQYSVLVTTNGWTYGWGYSSYGQYASDLNATIVTPRQFNVTFPLEPNEIIEYVSGGDNMSTYLTSQNRVFLLGSRYINTEQSSPIVFDFEVGEEVQEISSHESYALILTTDGRVFGWGNNYYGQIGDGMWGSVYNRFQPVLITHKFLLQEGEYFISIATGKDHSLACTSQGRVFAWGNNNYGQLGDDTLTMREVPVEITSQFSLFPEETIVSVLAGYEHSMAISSLGKIFVWGSNQYGQLGIGSSAQYIDIPVSASYGMYTSFNTGETIIKLILNRHTTYAITSHNQVLAWGANNNGILGNNDQYNSYIPLNITSNFELQPDEFVIKISSGINHALAVTNFGRVFAWGVNDYGQLGISTVTQSNMPVDITGLINVDVDSQIIDIEVSPNSSVALSDNGKVFVWGQNLYNMLGTTNGPTLVSPLEVSSNFSLETNESIVKVDCGVRHCFYETSEHRLFSRGHNFYGVLGTGDFSKPYLMILKDFVKKDTVLVDYGTIFEPITIEINPFYQSIEWYQDKELTILNEIWYMPSNNLELYAKWIK